jgi:hypothetical protein
MWSTKISAQDKIERMNGNTLLDAFLYLVTAWLMRSLTKMSPLPQGTTTLTGPKQTVTFMTKNCCC